MIVRRKERIKEFIETLIGNAKAIHISKKIAMAKNLEVVRGRPTYKARVET